MKQNYPGFRITQLTAIVAVDTDGDEGIAAITGPGGFILPCVAADQERLDEFLSAARVWVNTGKISKCKVIQFTGGKVIEVIEREP